MKNYIKIEFIDKNNMLEPGVDAGGLLKEFLTEITNNVQIFVIKKFDQTQLIL